MTVFAIVRHDRVTGEKEDWMTSSDVNTKEYMAAIANHMSAKDSQYFYQYEDRESV